MKKSTYYVSQMDCPSEESLIRMRLSGVEGVSAMEFDLPGRVLHVYHEGDNGEITSALVSLRLGATLKEVREEAAPGNDGSASVQRRVLWMVLAINSVFFLVEMATGIVSGSMGLVADSLDMLADAFVYGMSLMAVGAAVSRKKRVALLSGLLQILLAVWGFSEVIRRFMGVEAVPEFRTMIVVSLFALAANAVCLWLLQRTRSEDAHIRASVIFSANDVVINMGVITAALFVWWLDSNIPDLVVGTAVFLIVIRGAVRILKLSK